MRTYHIAQGTLLNALWWPEWEGSPKGRAVYVYVYVYVYVWLIHFVVQWRLTQHCKELYSKKFN